MDRIPYRGRGRGYGRGNGGRGRGGRNNAGPGDGGGGYINGALERGRQRGRYRRENDGRVDDDTIGNNARDNKRQPRTIRPLGYKMLAEIASLDPWESVHRLAGYRKGLEKLIQDGEIRFDLMIQLMKALANACICETSPETLMEIVVMLQVENFVAIHLPKFIREWPRMIIMKESYKDVVPELVVIAVAVLSSMLAKIQSLLDDVGICLLCLEDSIEKCRSFGVVFSAGSIDQVNDLKKQLDTLVNEERDRQLAQSNCYRSEQDKLQPEDDFHDLPIFPLPEELQEGYRPFLRKNVVNHGYDNVQHYLDIHFRLLREDFVAPIRKGIAEYLEIKSATRKDDEKNIRPHDIHVYTDVQILEPIPIDDDIVYTAQFNIKSLSRVRWEQGRRLLHGALVCLSSDDFENVIFAVVAHRKPERLRQGLIELKFHGVEKILPTLFSQTYVMAESPAYFEAYRYVLRRLQTISEETFAFERYIIRADPRPDLPYYLRQNPNATYDLAAVAKQKGALSAVVANPRAWPPLDEFKLDQSQLQAFKAALTEELCCIQGPPGTGKTFIGLKIVQTLLRNRSVWSPDKDHSPILLICFTNHALDQFLEGIIRFMPKGIVRMGSRCRNEKLIGFTIKELRRNRSRVKTHHWLRKLDIREKMVNIVKRMRDFQKSIRTANTKILKELKLKDIIPRDQYKSLLQNPGDKANLKRGDYIAFWLGVIGEGHGIEAISSDEEESADAHTEVAPPSAFPTAVTQDATNTLSGEDREIDMVETDMIDEDRYSEDESDEAINEALRNIVDENEEDDGVDILGRISNDTNEWQVVGRKQLFKYVRKNLRKGRRMSEDQANNVKNIWELSLDNRWDLYRYWIHKYKAETQNKIIPSQEEYEKQARMMQEEKVEEDMDLIKDAKIIAFTTTGAAKQHHLIERLHPRIVIVEEAAEVLEAHIVTSLTQKCQHLILLGDHQQLRPSPTVHELAHRYHLDISLFERLIKNNFPKHRLNLQHRMRPEIASLLKIHDQFYPDLEDDSSVLAYENVRGIGTNIFFFDHTNAETAEHDDRSKSNKFEAEFLACLCRYFLQQGYNPEKITVITAYAGQLWNFKRYMPNNGCGDVRVCPIDRYQGEENDIILLSLVRSNEEGSIGFLKIANRVCVALSRAKLGLYCVGNFSLLSKENNVWKVITDHLRNRNQLGQAITLRCSNHPERTTDIKTVKDFGKVPEGGCTQPCKTRLDCGHVCPKVCHPRDTNHVNVKCTKPCTKVICELKHQCKNKCGSKCNSHCEEKIDKELTCGHTIKISCYLRNSPEVKCTAPCQKELKCGHQCEMKCGEKCSTYCEQSVTKQFKCGHQGEVECGDATCPEPCGESLACGHKCLGSCGRCKQGRMHVSCEQPCKRKLICGHTCKSTCKEPCPPCQERCGNRCLHSKCIKRCGQPCTPCKEHCEWKCSHEVCDNPCRKPCTRPPCVEPCTETMKCGHECIGICGEVCPEKCRACNKEEKMDNEELDARFVFLEDCKHVLEVKKLDAWMTDTTSDKDIIIQVKVCPKCETPIRRNLRYNNVVKKAWINVDHVKKRVLGDPVTIREKRQDIHDVLIAEYVEASNEAYLKRLVEVLEKGKRDDTRTAFMAAIKSKLSAGDVDSTAKMEKTDISSVVAGSEPNESVPQSKKDTSSPFTGESVRAFVTKFSPQLKTLLTETHATSMGQKMDMYKRLCEMKRKSEVIEDRDGNSERRIVLDRLFQDVLTWLSNLTYISEQNMADWNREIKRISALTRVMEARLLVSTTAHPQMRDVFKKLYLVLYNEGRPYSDRSERYVQRLFKDLRECEPGIGETEEVKETVVMTAGMSAGHWFKCRKGHFYHIGDRKGAIEGGKCPEC